MQGIDTLQVIDVQKVEAGIQALRLELFTAAWPCPSSHAMSTTELLAQVLHNGKTNALVGPCH